MPRGSRRSLIPFMIRAAGPGGVPDRDALLDDERRPLDEGVAACAHHHRAPFRQRRDDGIGLGAPAREHGRHDPDAGVCGDRSAQPIALRDGGALIERLGELGRQHAPLHHRGDVVEGFPAPSSPRARHTSSRAGPSRTRASTRPSGARSRLTSAHCHSTWSTIPSMPIRSPPPPSPSPEGAQRLAVHQLERGGHEVRARDRARRAARVLELVESRDDQAVGVGARTELHRRLRDHAERAERADEELRQIVARHVLHDLAAAAHDGAVGHHHREADEEVAGGAVEMSARARGVAREDAADRRPVGPGRVEREPLSALAELALERAEGTARLHRRGEIARLVLDEPAHALHPQHEAEAIRRPADAELGAPARRSHGNPCLRGQDQDRRDVLLRAGEDHGLGRAALEDMR